MKKSKTNAVQEAKDKIGKTFVHKFEELNVEVLIHDVKFVFGTMRYLVSVSGQSGSNKVWIWAPGEK